MFDWVQSFAIYLALGFGSNCQEFLSSCLWAQIPILENILGAHGHILAGGLEQLDTFQRA